MKTIIVEKDKFLFDKFSKEILKFLDAQNYGCPSSDFIFKTSDDTFQHRFQQGKIIRNFMKELEEGEELYFPFATPGLDIVGSVDGTEYDDEEAGLDLTDSFGFYFSLKDDKFVIKAALFMDNWRAGPHAMVLKDDDPDYVHFDGPMEKYIKKFIK